MNRLLYLISVTTLCLIVCACERTLTGFRNGTYHGETVDRLPCGYGRYMSYSGEEQYEGMWKEGKYDGYGMRTCGDTLYYGFFMKGLPEGEGVMRYPDGSRYSGCWQAGKRQGHGEMTDSFGRKYVGRWAEDSLYVGELHDSTGLYKGHFNRGMKAHGAGDYCSTDGHYYSGEWKEGVRDGFGFAVTPGEVLKCGVWKNGEFKGERMLYNSQRVYGIDISKYQHVIGRRVYAIDWKRLRVTHLGHISKKKVDGTVDYPVSFVYIKATEGQTVTNPYYLRDAAAARKYGYPVGAYHFFSTRSARQQAAYFLKKAALKKGDLPPMLDVELSDRQIRSMGGADVLYREMLTWLRIVARHSHTVPVIYVGQEFVNKYLVSAPEELKAYPVWVARYGEYKPYVHLLYWQLSPDGTVSGIRGDVDIDVFNGSEEQFEDYVRTQCVK